LRAVQNQDGGFGESIASYDDANLKGKGVSTPSQTAWGLIGLLAGSDQDDPAVERAVKHLIEQQNADGSWDEEQFTGTGFPRVFYLKYHLYRNYFPLYALARYQNLQQDVKEFHAFEIRPERENLRGTKRGNG
jgi:squalene-hopene/tetraprenyl-beta-curcumene cyclase